MHDHTKLHVWERAQQLAVDIYPIAMSWQRGRHSFLSSQLLRAAISVPENIARGAGMPTTAMFGYSLGVALGSISEVMCHLDVGHRIGALTQAQFEKFYDEARQIRAMLIVFRRRILGIAKPVSTD